MMTAPPGFPTVRAEAQVLGYKLALDAAGSWEGVPCGIASEAVLYGCVLMLVACAKRGHAAELLTQSCDAVLKMAAHPEFLEQLKLLLGPATEGRAN